MKTKKHPKANLENYSKLFAQLGLVLSLVIVYVLIQNKTFDHKLAILNGSNINMHDSSESIIEYIIEPPKAHPTPKKAILDVITEVDNKADVPETIFQLVDPDKPTDLSGVVDIVPVEEIIENVDFIIIEEAPAFPGCEGTKAEMKSCFTDKITRFVGKTFDAGLASELNLSSGIQRIFILFKIDSNGNIVEIKARAPHIKLKEEAIRVIKLLPKMEPGKQRGKPVNVKYALPIVFKIE